MIRILLVYALVLLVVGSCHATSLDERAIMCKPVDSEECVSLRKQADRLAAIKDRRITGTCPPSYVVYKDHKGTRCVSEREVNHMLGGDW